ncbi:right-handed parallel beta-helix repeat-containing protein [Sphingorhabdus sp.]|jgi:hypothetical protein|uniref:right-handed parallel beta-helix repeat-containing protein n=2 Tax=Sphingorhabdus sp. TaxID=1902408 RepID=UPI003BB109A8|nr:right-handed parallel beta-helix repeat-containing protein [Sphingomonadales bacterium]MBK9432807.1 right-handed parallel beta-helix repeat-containing protein [Sphingomonadales bacterium]
MKLFLARILVVLGAFVAFAATPAMAQATRTWVSGVGDDANPCSRTAPCKTFAGAISKTASGGEINALDSGGFGAVTITKSITIRAVGLEAGILTSGTNGIVINAGATGRVLLDGLDFEGLNTSLSAISILSGQVVDVRNTTIRNYTDGITISGTPNVRLTVDNTHFSNVLVGIKSTATGGKAIVRADNSIFVTMGTAAILVDGAPNSAFISGNSFWGAPKALQILNGATVTSFGNNTIGTTATDNPTTTLPLR